MMPLATHNDGAAGTDARYREFRPQSRSGDRRRCSKFGTTTALSGPSRMARIHDDYSQNDDSGPWRARTAKE